jgi:cytochrome c553
MTDENAHTETDASPATTQPDQPAKNAPVQETNEQMDDSSETEDSGLSSVMRAIKYELEEKDMTVIYAHLDESSPSSFLNQSSAAFS